MKARAIFTSRFSRYCFAILVAFAALYLRGLLGSYLGASNPFHTAWLAVVIAAWWLGLGPSILTLVIESLGVWYYFLPQQHSWRFADVSAVGALVGFVVLSALIVVLGEVNRRGHERVGQQARLLDLSYDAIFVHDSDHRIVYWSRGATETYGYTRDEAVGRVALELLGTVFPVHREAIVDKLRHHQQWSGELIHTQKDGSKITVSSRWALFRDKAGSESIMEINRDITALKNAEAELREYHEELEQKVEARTTELTEANKQLSKLSATLLRAQDEERRRVARELHDSAGQYLAAVTMALDVVKNEVKSRDHSLERKLSEASSATEACIKEIRTLSHLLHPPLLDELGLAVAVSHYVDGFAARSGIHVETEIPEDLPRLGNDVEILLFRVLQESLTNVHRHSGSKLAIVRIDSDSQRAWIEVQDCGKGAGKPNNGDSLEPFRPGVGITGIRERARQLGGKAEITADTTGTRVRIVVPLPAEARAIEVKVQTDPLP